MKRFKILVILQCTYRVSIEAKNALTATNTARAMRAGRIRENGEYLQTDVIALDTKEVRRRTKRRAGEK